MFNMRLFALFFSILILSACGGGGGGSDAGGTPDPITVTDGDSDGTNDGDNDGQLTGVELVIEKSRNWVATDDQTSQTLEFIPMVRTNSTEAFKEMTKGDIYWRITEGSEYASMSAPNRRGIVTALAPCPADTPYCVEVEAKIITSTSDVIIETTRLLVKGSAENIAPTANAGADQTVTGGDQVFLDGSKSFDLDGTIISWEWRVQSGNLTDFDISSRKTSSASFFAPNSKQTQVIVLELTVTDDLADTATDLATITINPDADLNASTVNVEKPDDIIEGQSVTLVGSFEDIDDTAAQCDWYWSTSTDGERTLIKTISPCPQKPDPFQFTPVLSSVPSDVYVTLIVTDWLGQTSQASQMFFVDQKTVETVMYTVTASSGTGGSISPTEQPVVENETQVFTVTPDIGYKIASVSGCGVTPDGNTFLTAPITAECHITATFEKRSYDVSASVDSTGGTIAPSGTTPVLFEGTTFFEITPDIENGYEINEVTGCGGKLEGNIFTTGQISGACSVVASFKLKTYQVTATAQTGGTISPTSRPVTHSQKTDFTVTPGEGYEINQVTGCGGNLDGNSYNTGDITGDCAVTATFKHIQYEVKAVAGEGGSVSPTSSSIEHNQSTSFEITPNEGYEIDTYTGCSGNLAGNIFTTDTITEACTLSITFKLIQYDITTNVITTGSGTGGTITPTSLTAEHGKTYGFTIEANEGYRLDDATGCGGTLSGTSFTTDTITADCTITANFIQQHTITATISENGSIEETDEDNQLIVDHNDLATFTITPDTGYEIDQFDSDCSGIRNGLNYTTGEVTADCDFGVTFKKIEYSISGTVTGLAPGASVSLKLAYNGTESISVDTNTFSFAQKVPYGDSYQIDITALPEDGGKTIQNCRIRGGGSPYGVTKISNIDTGEIEISCIHLSTINDTGINFCATKEDVAVMCPIDDFPNQDAQYGKDYIDSKGLLVKRGQGKVGSFQKVCNSGELSGEGNCPRDGNYYLQEPSEITNRWGCTLDMNTGLMWEVKINDANSVRHKDHSFTWYYSDANINGEISGSIGDIETCNATLSFCNTEEYISIINQQGLCGYHDWRLPNRVEVQSIVSYGQTNPAIETAYFPNTISSSYWTSTTRARNTNNAWIIRMYYGDFNAANKASYQPRIRLVRGGK